MIKILVLITALVLPIFAFWQYQLYVKVPKTKVFGLELTGTCTSSAACSFGTFCQPINVKQERSGSELVYKPTQEYKLCVPYIYKTFQTLKIGEK